MNSMHSHSTHTPLLQHLWSDPHLKSKSRSLVDFFLQKQSICLSCWLFTHASSVVDVWQLCLSRFPPLELRKGTLNSSCVQILTPKTNTIRCKFGLTHVLISLKKNLSTGQARLIDEWWDAPLKLRDFSHSNILCYLCQHFFLTCPLLSLTEPVFLLFLNDNSAQKWKKAKIYKSEYRADNITQWFCRTMKLCII